ncbi:MAG: response regulator transcription factor [Candidatus Planktophila sp.]|nr:response regulator transcription factor [Candidatus Planktophila sp.]
MNEITSSDKTIRVLVVDDHSIFRAGIIDRLSAIVSQIEVIGEGSNGIEAYELAKKHRPNVILMDISMPGVNGIETTKKITSEFPEIEVIILSVYDDDQYINASLEAGASGYLLKSVEAQELSESIIKVASGGSALSSTIARKVLSRISRGGTEIHGLSEREIHVLKLVAKGSSNKSIARELFLSVRTVEAHLHNIFEALNVSSRTEAVTKAVRNKWIELEQ